MTQLKLNENIPNFILPSTTGETFSYETHQKEHQSWHLIIFFRGAWCPVCVQDLKDLEENKNYFESKNVHLITISTDELDNLKKMADEYNLSYPVLSDKNLEALK